MLAEFGRTIMSVGPIAQGAIDADFKGGRFPFGREAF
jgi:hypothetical protein